MNMSYCRFQNTLKDLRDCFEHLDDDNLSQDEQRAREKMIRLAQAISDAQDDDGDSDDE